MIMNPAKSVIDKIGGYAAAAQITGKHISRVYRWTYPASRGGTGGVVPQADALKLLSHARTTGISLSSDDFLQEPKAIDHGGNS